MAPPSLVKGRTEEGTQYAAPHRTALGYRATSTCNLQTQLYKYAMVDRYVCLLSRCQRTVTIGSPFLYLSPPRILMAFISRLSDSDTTYDSASWFPHVRCTCIPIRLRPLY